MKYFYYLQILFEAIIVGLTLAGIYYITTLIHPDAGIKYIHLVLSGFLFHVLFEAFGWNKRYCVNYVKNFI